MAKQRKARRWKGKPVYIEPDEETQEWIKQPKTQKADLAAIDLGKQIHNKQGKGK